VVGTKSVDAAQAAAVTIRYGAHGVMHQTCCMVMRRRGRRVRCRDGGGECQVAASAARGRICCDARREMAAKNENARSGT